MRSLILCFQRRLYLAAKLMGSSAEILKEKISTSLKPQFLEVVDFSDGCGAKFNVLVVSKEFDGQPLIKRHRMVNESIKDEMPKIHALTLKTYTPEQWKDLQKDHNSAL